MPGESTPAPARRARWENLGDKPWKRRGAVQLWKVKDSSGQHPDVAVLKTLPRAGSTARARFEREVEITMDLCSRHPGIVRVLDVGVDESGAPYYVMPLAESSLDRAADLVGQIEPVIQIAITLSGALGAAHTAGVIHRDIKGSNVLLYGDKRLPALSDFGICYVMEEDRLTKADGGTLGTEHYVAPELLGGGQREPTVRSDMYSLGKMMYATVAGEHCPREEYRRPEWDLSKRFGDRRFDHLTAVIERMSAHNPDHRFLSMVECQEQLGRALENARRDVPYVPGMYGGPQIPLERFIEMGRSVRRPRRIWGGRMRCLPPCLAVSGQRRSTFEPPIRGLLTPIGLLSFRPAMR
jgi:serine/threonine protein kinase